MNKESGEREDIADRFAENLLISEDDYNEFVLQGQSDVELIKDFSKRIRRDPGIVVRRLQNDKHAERTDRRLNELRKNIK